MNGLDVLYNFHPVGQGVFSSGMIKPTDGSSKCFWWVFDCGTHLVKHRVRRDDEIENLAAMIGTPSAGRRPRIDLIFISHFDKDHVNGLLKLLERFEVGRLVIPFIPLHKRLVIAFSGNSPQQPQPWQLFTLAPSLFVQDRGYIQIDRLTVVLPSGSEGPSDNNDSAPRPWDEDPVEIVPPPVEPPAEINEFDNLSGTGVQIDWLTQGASLRVGSAWEFVPYNDPATVIRASLGFRQSAKVLADQIVKAPCDMTRKAIKAQIVGLYGQHHGITPPEKNLISLFVYAGPLFKPKLMQLIRLHPHPWRLPYFKQRYFVGMAGNSKCKPKRVVHAVLYTGDGFLKSTRQLSDMLSYFGPARIQRAKVVQVMHHGSRSSWHSGVATALAPEYSIFCAYQHGLYFHPHTDVWDDFRGYGRWVCGANVREMFALYQELSI